MAGTTNVQAQPSIVDASVPMGVLVEAGAGYTAQQNMMA